jgi:sugar phosphate isomerase/epimerase
LSSDKDKLTWELGLFAPSASQLTVADTVSLLSQGGYRWVEWRVQTSEAIDSNPWGKAYNTLAIDDLGAQASAAAPILKEAGVGVCGMQVDVPEGFPDVEKIVLDAAQAMGCPNVLLTGPSYDPVVGLRSQRDAFRKVIAAWVNSAKNTGVRICVENHMWTIIPSTALVVELLAEFSPAQVGVMWDPANSIWEGSETSPMALDLLGDYLAEVHLKNGAWARQEDGTWAFDWCDIAEGMVDWPATLGLLQAAGYQGPLVVEDYRPAEPADKLAVGKEGLKWALQRVKE